MKKMSSLSILICISLTLTSCLGNPESNRDQVELPSEGEPITTPPPELDENPPPPNGADSPYPLSDNIFFVGHSLVSPTLPAFMNSILQSAGGSGQADYQVINGSPLGWNWQNSHTAEGLDGRTVLPSGDYSALILTEAIPLQAQITWWDSGHYAHEFYQAAMTGNPNTRVYLYETWHCILSGTAGACSDPGDSVPWRQRLDDDLSLWESIVDEVNHLRGGAQPEMLLVPAGQAMARLYDEISAGQVPGVSSLADIFSDDIHLTSVGFYYVSMVQYATIYRRSPIGLPSTLAGEYSDLVVLDSATAAKLRELAWLTVCSYPRSGVNCQ
jgi:hypothetical protein